ncbi:RHS repeat-associated core domain-containing protein [Pandoraea sp.]|uniref:RHS repeat-associated core domain-containing protein n=1 Tax=Pandoraea sp. TaxID=1883445 RepID=UPI0025FD600E|nr:RHS repeat-associated core domain-containing protein [Pandoraea sp.]
MMINKRAVEQYRYGGDGLRVCQESAANRMRRLPGLELRRQTQAGQAHWQVVRAERGGMRWLCWRSGRSRRTPQRIARHTLADHLDSATVELDEAARVVSQEAFYPYGGTAVWAARSAVEAVCKTRRYAGRERDASGLADYGLRTYSTWLGRWINPDPAGAADGLNRFAFVHGNPLTLTDRHGLSAVDAFLCAQLELDDGMFRYDLMTTYDTADWSSMPALPASTLSLHGRILSAEQMLGGERLAALSEFESSQARAAIEGALGVVTRGFNGMLSGRHEVDWIVAGLTPEDASSAVAAGITSPQPYAGGRPAIVVNAGLLVVGEHARDLSDYVLDEIEDVAAGVPEYAADVLIGARPRAGAVREWLDRQAEGTLVHELGHALHIARNPSEVSRFVTTGSLHDGPPDPLHAVQEERFAQRLGQAIVSRHAQQVGEALDAGDLALACEQGRQEYLAEAFTAWAYGLRGIAAGADRRAVIRHFNFYG